MQKKIDLSSLARWPGVKYPGVAKLFARLQASIGTGMPCKALVALEPGALLSELVVISIYAYHIVFEIPNGKGGHRYVRISYEQMEYPKHSIAARAQPLATASLMFPIEPKMSASKREKQAALQEEYITDHWHDYYDSVVLGMRAWEQRQRQPAPVYHNVRRDFMSLGAKVFRFVLECDWHYGHERIVLNCYEDIAPTKKFIEDKFRAFIFRNWTLTYEEILQHCCLLPR